MASEKKREAARHSGPAVIDAQAMEQAGDIFHHLANTVSAMKIFPPEHATAQGFIDTLAGKLKGFLDIHGKMEIHVDEYSFVYGNRPVYTDELMIKSLPFYFFKDGLQILYFYQGLEREEIADFLALIRAESQKPKDEGDIVTAMWERDFVNIQYYAPDDYLENRIIKERGESQAKLVSPSLLPEFTQEVIEIKVDTSKFTTGKIVLTEEDREKVNRAALPEPAGREDPASSDLRDPGRSPAAAMDPNLLETEIRDLEAMIRANRTISPEEEFLELMVEILYLEKDLGNFRRNIETLKDFHLEQIGKGNFAVLPILVGKLRDLRDHLVPSNPGKTGCLDVFLKEAIAAGTVDAVKESIARKPTVDWDAFLDFLTVLGPPAFLLAADIFGSLPDPDSRKRALDFISDIGLADPAFLAGLAGDERPLFSREILRLLAGQKSGKGLPHISAFLGFKSKELRLDAVRVLGEAGNEMANRILMGFLNDGDEDVRIQAALNLNPIEEKSRIQQVIREASSRTFNGKSFKEKQAIMTFIGRTRTEEAFSFLRRTLERGLFWPWSGKTELRLAAIAGLESLGTAEAAQVLERAARSRNKAVREASAKALLRRAKGMEKGFEAES